MLVNLIAIVISVTALASSSYLAFQQGRLMRNANFIPVYADMLAEFRTLAFNDHYYFVTRNLTAECEPNSGITGLPDAARTAVYDVAYYFQNFAALRLIGVIDDQIIAAMHIRIQAVWEAIAPFVYRERELWGTPYLLLVLEGFAADTDVSVKPFSQLLRQRRNAQRQALQVLSDSAGAERPVGHADGDGNTAT